MATLNFPDDPSSGDKYTDSNSGFTYEWDGTVWKSSDPSTAANIREIDDISGDFDGSDTTFTLKVAGVNVEPANVQQLIISVGGVMQNAGDDYTLSGSTLTFTTAPTSGLTFFGTLLGTALSLNTVADGSVGRSSLSTTTSYLMGGLTVDQSAGIITAYQFKGDGSGLTGVASTDNIKTSTDAYFGANVSIGGSLTVQGTETIINVEELNVQDKTIGIGSTSTPTATTQDGAGAIIYGQTHINILYDVDKAALGISTGVNVSGFVTATRAQVGTGVTINNTGVNVTSGIVTAQVFSGLGATVGGGVTINNTGIDAGIGAGIITAKEYYGDATNMTGAGSTFQVLTVSPYQDEQLTDGTPLAQNIIMSFNHAISAGNADKNITLRTGSASGTVVETFDVDSDVTYSYSQAIMNPASNFELENTYFVVADEGAVMKVGTATSSPLINGYKFTTADAYHQLFTWGMNEYGILGQNQAEAQVSGRSSPTQVGTSENWGVRASQDTGNSSTYMTNIKTDGTLWSWGVNTVGGLGQNNTTKYSSPTQVGTNTNWSNLISGSEGAHIAVKTDGTLWSWGQNDTGQLGKNQNATQWSSPTQIGTGTDWGNFIATGSNCFAAIKTTGTLWVWGNGYQGQLGLNQGGAATQYSSPVQVGTDTTWSTLSRGGNGTNNILATKTDGTFWAWGRGDYGILGLNANTYRSSPTQVGTDTTWAILAHQQADENNVAIATKTDGTLWSWGSGGAGAPSVSGARGYNNASLGAVSSPIQVGSNTTWPNDKNKPYRISAGKLQVGAIKTDGTLWTWGKNNGGQLGLNENDDVGNPSGRSSPTQVGTQTDWDSIYIHGSNTNVTQTAQATTKSATPG